MEKRSLKKIYLILIRIDHFISVPIIKWVILPFLCLIFWLSMSILANPIEGASVISQTFFANDITHKPINEVMNKGDFLDAIFRARNNNLGIIAVNIDFEKKDYTEKDDILKFYLFDDSNKVLYSTTNSVSSFLEYRSLVFGFPKIVDSNGREFKFRVESIHGKAGNRIRMMNSKEQFFAKYQLSKNEIINSPKSFFVYLFKKLIGFVTNSNDLIATNLYILPLILYLVWISILRKIIFSTNFFTYLVFALISIDVFIFRENIFALVFLTIFIWIFSIFKNHYPAKISIYIFFALFLLGLFFASSNQTSIITKFSAWSYIFLLIGAIHLAIEEKRGILLKKS